MKKKNVYAHKSLHAASLPSSHQRQWSPGRPASRRRCLLLLLLLPHFWSPVSLPTRSVAADCGQAGGHVGEVTVPAGPLRAAAGPWGGPHAAHISVGGRGNPCHGVDLLMPGAAACWLDHGVDAAGSVGTPYYTSRPSVRPASKFRVNAEYGRYMFPCSFRILCVVSIVPLL